MCSSLCLEFCISRAYLTYSLCSRTILVRKPFQVQIIFPWLFMRVAQHCLTLGRGSYHRYNKSKCNSESFQCPWGGLHRQYQSPAALGGQGCRDGVGRWLIRCQASWQHRCCSLAFGKETSDLLNLQENNRVPQHGVVAFKSRDTLQLQPLKHISWSLMQGIGLLPCTDPQDMASIPCGSSQRQLSPSMLGARRHPPSPPKAWYCGMFHQVPFFQFK